ncbi:MAG: tetratricopeptide repeat protein [Proteobacteria bacterium]|nr:tetratricopeptide repeat protein [Pseudomonadota bacterium]
MPQPQQLTINQAISRAKKATKHGNTAVALQLYNAVLQHQPNHPVAKKGLRKLQKGLPNDQSVQVETANPSQDQINTLVNLYHSGQMIKAEQGCKELLQTYPQSIIVINILGVALQGQGKLQDAVESYEKAIQLKPDCAEAYSNRGSALKDLGQLEKAIESQQKAVSISPQNSMFWGGFADILQAMKLTFYNDDLGCYLLHIIEQPTIRPRDISKAIVNALHYHPIVIPILELSKSDYIDEDIDHLTEQLSTVPLLLRVMELSPLADLDVEKMLTKIRKAMLHMASSGGSEAQGLPFYAALAIHCFVNEYVFTESETEKQEIELLQEKVKVTIRKGGTVSPTRIAVLGSYRPLCSFSWAEDLLKCEWADEIKKVIVRQVDDIREEQTLRSKIPRLTSIEDKVSQLVRNQYEENPYPRWINTGLSDKPRRIKQVLPSIKLYLNFDVQQFSNKPEILVAGCGTGQHALHTASRFLNCNVLAVDLSLSSLSYAIRKTQELGVTNIEYMQGDILQLDQLERQFDIIESVGVLHHMDDPLAGWKVLVAKLHAGGLMKIGLYSNIARQGIVEAIRQITKKEYTSSPGDIRRYREELINMDLNPDSEISKIIGYSDFYSLSECRDLLFHVQEHRFTLPQIEEALSGLGLNFLGFEMKQSLVRSKFIERYPEKDALLSLPLWHQFELENPDTFLEMYQFWVQKA